MVVAPNGQAALPRRIVASLDGQWAHQYNGLVEGREAVLATNGLSGPLKGIRVLDWTMWQLGPVTASMMGDMGADVVKIEALDGDAGRSTGAASLRPSLAQGRNAYFEAANRNKRGIALNLKTPEGVDIVYRLVETADVFIQNFRQGVAERLGLGYETLREINSMLIYGSGTGYGPRGADSARPSFDGIGQARSGLMMSATPVGAEPMRVGGGISDQVGAIMLCLGVTAALMAREKQGVGQSVEASHLSANMWIQGQSLTMSLLSGTDTAPYDRKAPVNPLSNSYQCKDGTWMHVFHAQPDRYWKPFAAVFGIEELVDDPRFDNINSRHENSKELTKILDQRFATRTYDEWDQALRAGGDFIYDRVQHLHELEADPQVIANDYITSFDHPALGPVKACNHPNIYSETPAGYWREAPELGQHTEEILIEELGLDWDDIGRLREAGAIL